MGCGVLVVVDGINERNVLVVLRQVSVAGREVAVDPGPASPAPFFSTERRLKSSQGVEEFFFRSWGKPSWTVCPNH